MGFTSGIGRVGVVVLGSIMVLSGCSSDDATSTGERRESERSERLRGSLTQIAERDWDCRMRVKGGSGPAQTIKFVAAIDVVEDGSGTMTMSHIVIDGTPYPSESDTVDFQLDGDRLVAESSDEQSSGDDSWRFEWAGVALDAVSLAFTSTNPDGDTETNDIDVRRDGDEFTFSWIDRGHGDFPSSLSCSPD